MQTDIPLPKNSAQLLHGDCLQRMAELPDNSIDLILTDPPYNLGLFMKNRATNLAAMRKNYFGAAGWDDAPEAEWESLMSDFFAESARLLKPGASMIVFMAVIKVETIIKIAQNHNFYYKTTGIWHKTNPMPRNMNLHFINSTEAWIYFTYQAKRGTFNNRGLALHDFFETSITPKSEKQFGTHPTQKPIKLLQYLIEATSDLNSTVLDPFMGSGSTGVAALNLNRKFIGIEANPEYTDLAINRIQGEALRGANN